LEVAAECNMIGLRFERDWTYRKLPVLPVIALYSRSGAVYCG